MKTKATDSKIGAFVAVAASFPIAVLFAYIFRLPIPLGGYIGPFGKFSIYDTSIIEVLTMVSIAWIFYGIFGGIIILIWIGSTVGKMVGSKYAESEDKNLMIIFWAAMASVIPIFFISILDYIIGSW